MVILMVLLLLLAVLLIAVVLLQPSKGDMVGSSFGGVGGSMNSMFGARGSLQVMQKLTIGIATAMVLLSITVNIMTDNPAQATENVKAASEEANWQPEAPAPAPAAQPAEAPAPAQPGN
jgi:preprotein translocase subunit SecG